MINGLQVDQTSYRIRYYYLFGLQPKWGGSVEELREFFDETLSYSDENPKLKSLTGFLYYVVGDVKSYYDNTIKNPVISCKASKSNLNRALEASVNPLFYSRRGDNNVCLKEYDEAIADFTSAINLKPENVSYRRQRGNAYKKSKQYDLALADLNWVINRDPLDPKALKYRAEIYATTKKTQEAFRDYESSLYFDKNNKITYRDMGNLHHFQTKNYKQAIEYLKKAIELGDDGPIVYLLLAMSQYNNFDCDFIQSSKKYLNRCEEESSCKKDHLRWVQQTNVAVKSSGMCQ